ncbi:M1-specific T cell receptor alpha chain-like, partial [Eucyclogobius newberryi]|uniref:M1-specific T cell receptor alpha chain-like n=1 Tax=Eucyclogobius newberryi TaxID=166745 RepID=UPI003B58B58A
TNTRKLLFGAGTRLNVQTTEDEEPSFYRLKNNDIHVCLASGFSRPDKLKKNDLFQDANGTFIDRESEDSDIKGLYSQVALMSTADDERCPESSGYSEDSLKADPAVNLISLTVLGLRILFIKTIVFNVLFTLRLCMT